MANDTISALDKEVADALAYLRDAGVLPAGATPQDLMRYCVLTTAESVRKHIAKHGRFDEGAFH